MEDEVLAMVVGGESLRLWLTVARIFSRVI